jgi:hypothetical protein
VLILDEATWGKPAPGQIVEQHWNWKLSDDEWRAAVAQKGEGKREEVKFDLWLPEGLETVKKGDVHPMSGEFKTGHYSWVVINENKKAVRVKVKFKVQP